MYHLAAMGQVNPRIPEMAASEWVNSAFQNILGRAPLPAEEQDLVNSLRIGARSFDESLAIIRAKAPRAPALPGPAMSRPRASAPSPTGPPGFFSTLPTWAWWAGGAALAGVGLMALGGRR